MRRSVGFAFMVLVPFLAAVCLADESQTLTVSGKLIRVGKDSKIVDDATGTRTGDEQSREKIQDPSVVITQTYLNDKGIPVKTEVASASFKNGAVELQGLINKRACLLVSVNGVGEETLYLEAVAAPGDDLSFAVLDYVPPRRKDRILRVGESRMVEHSDGKFTIQGDLSSITDKDLSVATAEIRFMSETLPKGSATPASTSVLLDDGKFQFEGFVDEPTVVEVHVKVLNLREYWGVAHLVVEPNARIKISPSKTSSSYTRNKASELKATTEIVGSMHAELVESWQDSAVYLAKMDEYADSINSKEQEIPMHAEVDVEDSEKLRKVDPYEIFVELETIKHAVLSPIAKDLSDPMRALLAMELGAPESQQYEEWDRLAEVLDPDLVERRVKPRYSSRMKQRKSARNSKLVVKGKIAPEFSLSDLHGEEIELSGVLAENEVVLVDFWASWCGPCIETIPQLKELHADYKDKGFEIVFISIDAKYDDWKNESDKQELPWLNLGDLDGEFLAQTAVEYGVLSIPAKFVLSKSGEILQREVDTDRLKRLLVEQLDNESRK
ncbi:MAG: TlpA disulfide reductase family protein [Gammaproteobacteria bacterium]|nr:TlpA disulfide reductase family protein [Gammaproteobacteria bacterium]